MKRTITITGEIEDIHDSWHSVDELYNHRMVLFVALMKSHPHLSWKSKKHNDGTSYGGYFIAGMELPDVGMITYHIVDNFWDKTPEIQELEIGRPWDGHTSEDVIVRLSKWCGL